MEKKGIIEQFTVIINPQRIDSAISCYFEIETDPAMLESVISDLSASDDVTQIYRTTGNCRLHVHAVVSNQDELDRFTSGCLDKLKGVRSISSNVILSRIKDVKGLRL